jgi:benzylsuccinate CoA-transferase BbsF subunit
VLEAAVNGRVLAARGNASPHYAPSGVYPVVGADRWIAIAAPDDATWRSLSEEADHSGATDARFASPVARLAQREELERVIAAWTQGEQAASLEERLQARGVPVHRVASSEDVFADPGLAARGHFVTLAHREVGPVPYEHSRMRFSRTPAVVDRASPTLGQDNDYALHDVLDLGDDEITELVIAGAIE